MKTYHCVIWGIYATAFYFLTLQPEKLYRQEFISRIKALESRVRDLESRAARASAAAPLGGKAPVSANERNKYWDSIADQVCDVKPGANTCVADSGSTCLCIRIVK